MKQMAVEDCCGMRLLYGFGHVKQSWTGNNPLSAMPTGYTGTRLTTTEDHQKYFRESMTKIVKSPYGVGVYLAILNHEQNIVFGPIMLELGFELVHRAHNNNHMTDKKLEENNINTYMFTREAQKIAN